MSDSLFDDFQEVSDKQWKQLIQYELNGADYNKTLVWESNEGIHVNPFYTAEIFHKSPLITTRTISKWHICQTIFVANVEKSNQKAIDVLTCGVQSIKFILPNDNIVLKDLLANINLLEVPVVIECQFLSEVLTEQIAALPKNNKVRVQTDIIGHLAGTGNWFRNFISDHDHFGSIVKHTNTIAIAMDLYQNAGATMVQQLAYGLAHASEYLHFLTPLLTDEEKKDLQVFFNVSVGSNYFFEIAKLRAMRRLWESLAEVYGFNQECLIFVQPTKRNKTLYNHHTNLLRTTTECMSAVLGGANIICNTSFDAIYRKDNAFAERMARNQLLIIKHESYFDKVDNIAEGSYYIESLTQQLAEKSWELFKDIETNGGFLHQLKEGIIQRKIKESAAKEQKQFDNGGLVLVGTNNHPNNNDRMKSSLELYPFVKRKSGKTLIEPIIEKRLAEAMEQARLKEE